MNVFRKEYRTLGSLEQAHLEALKNKAQELYELIEADPNTLLPTVRTSREISLAKTKLEEAIMWAVKDVTR